MEKNNKTRRDFFKFSLLGLASLPFVKHIIGSEALASACKEPKKLIDAATSKRLDYVADASNSKNKKYNKGEQCYNCNFYKGDKCFGKCTMAGMKDVAAPGWCKSYKLKASMKGKTV